MCIFRANTRVIFAGVNSWGPMWLLGFRATREFMIQAYVRIRVGVVVGVHMIRFYHNHNTCWWETLTRLSVPTALIQDGMTALIWASQFGHLEVADLLLRHGARVRHKDKVMRGNG